MSLEKDIIRLIQKFAPAAHSDLALPPGDDASFLSLSRLKKKYLTVSTDQLVENVHFSWDWCSPREAAHKLVQMNLSDIIVKGGNPLFALLNLQLSDKFVIERQNILDFAQELGSSLREYGIQLIGGDTTSSQTDSFTLTLIGESDIFISRVAESSNPIKEGDLIIISGQVGGSSLALSELTHKKDKNKVDASLREYYTRPQAQWKNRDILRELRAKISIDQSDSLSQSLSILSHENQIHCEIYTQDIPHPKELDHAEFSEKIKHILGGGEDFAFVFIIDPAMKKQLDILTQNDNQLRCVGKVLSVGNSHAVDYFHQNKKIEADQLEKVEEFFHWGLSQ